MLIFANPYTHSFKNSCKKSCVNESIIRLYFCIFALIYAKLRAYNLRSLVRSVGGHLDHNRRLVTSNDLTLRPLKNSLKSYDDSTIITCIKIIPKSPIFARKSRKSFKKLLKKSEKSNRRIHSQIQDWTPTSRDIDELQKHREKLSKINNRELPSGGVYFLNISEQKFFSNSLRDGFQSCFSSSKGVYHHTAR
jgi:hypothetical protein